MVSPVIAAVIAVVAGVVAAAIAFFAGVSYRRKTAEAKIGSAEEEAKRLINDAMKAAQQKRKQSQHRRDKKPSLHFNTSP